MLMADVLSEASGRRWKVGIGGFGCLCTLRGFAGVLWGLLGLRLFCTVRGNVESRCRDFVAI